MGGTRHLQVTLPDDMAEQIERKVESGAYATVSEVVRDGIRELLDRDTALEQWLRNEVVKSIEEYKANPASAVPADQVKARVLKQSAQMRNAPKK